MMHFGSHPEVIYILHALFIAMVAAFGFIPFYLSGGVFTPARIFSTITLLSGIRLSMTNFMPKAYQFIVESAVSFERIQKFMLLPDLDEQKLKDMDDSILKTDSDLVISMKNASFTWSADISKSQSNPSTKEEKKIILDEKKIDSKDDLTILFNIDAHIKQGQLVFIVGPVGSGKSSFANAILGEMIKVGGTYAVDKAKTIAYACQNPWILNATIRENILFGKTFDTEWYARVVECCALTHDLTLFDSGDSTFIGERGVNLSGGQKARLSLARAVYSQADIYCKHFYLSSILVLDDPLSAVDTKVGRHIFDQCINGLIKRHTRLLITHQLQYINADHQVLLMEEGKKMAMGFYSHVVSTVNTPFTKTMKEFVNAIDEDLSEEIISEESGKSGEDNNNLHLGTSPHEVSATGTVTWSTYYTYFMSGSNGFVILVFFFGMVLGQALSILTDYWLSRWTVQPPATQLVLGPQNAYVYSILTLSVFFISMARAIMFFLLAIAASRIAFIKMLGAILRSPLHFFQTTPVGQSMKYCI